MQEQGRMELVYLEQLVRPDHLLQKVHRYVDFAFITDKMKDLYCENNGRPALDPVVLFKMLLIGYKFGIRSERRLVQEIADNLAYRWFLGFGLNDKILAESPAPVEELANPPGDL
jgi:transposase